MRRLTVALAALFAAALSGTVGANEDAFAAVWRETGFDRIAILDHGIKKTLATYARDHLEVITPDRFRRGHDRVTLLLRLVAAPAVVADDLRLPIEGDALIPLLESAGIEVGERSVRLRDCFRFDETGQIAQIDGASVVAFNALRSMELNEEGNPVHARDVPLYTATTRLLGRVFEVMELPSNLRLIPHPIDLHGQWATFAEVDSLADELPEVEGLRREFDELLAAVAADDVDQARMTAAGVTQTLAALPNYPTTLHRNVDYAYTAGRPYLWASVAYVLAAVLFLANLVTHGRRWWLAAVIAMGSGWIVHMLGAAARGYLIGRVPLSNLYEATTTGLAFVILVALVLEIVHRVSVIGFMSALLSFIYYRWLLSSAQFGSDAIEPLRAVLNSYWLDYHVTCMILSYGAFTVAFGMAVLYLLKSHFPQAMRWAPAAEQLDLCNHRAIQIGWPILGIGVVLGAIWADTAWGRMWSWDPKETWALITWFIYTVYVHVRFVHGGSGRVMAWASVAGYGCVIFTYLGVNTVLSGLHSYASNSDVTSAMTTPLAMVLWVVLLAVFLVSASVAVSLFVRGRRESTPEAP